MKKLLISGLLVTLLAGCGSFGALLDTNEYERYTIITYTAEQAVPYCGTDQVEPFIKQLQTETGFVELYTKHMPYNEDSHQIALILQSQATDLYAHYKKGMSTVYCQQKLGIIKQGSERAMEAVIQKRTN